MFSHIPHPHPTPTSHRKSFVTRSEYCSSPGEGDTVLTRLPTLKETQEFKDFIVSNWLSFKGRWCCFHTSFSSALSPLPGGAFHSAGAPRLQGLHLFLEADMGL